MIRAYEIMQKVLPFVNRDELVKKAVQAEDWGDFKAAAMYFTQALPRARSIGDKNFLKMRAEFNLGRIK